jgi:DNA-binding LacI/PurR family transcriptional regulator
VGRQRSQKPTSFDIAHIAGVSQPTVSRALRGDRAISQSTRERVQRIANDLHYTVDKHASALRSQRSNTIALLFFEDPTPDQSMINPFFLSMLGSITRACANRGLDLLISFQRLEDDWHVNYQDSNKADGIILLGYGDYTVYAPRHAQLVQQGTHFVRWGSVSDDASGATIGSDNVGAGRMAGAHLIEKGRKRIAFLGHGDGHYPEFAERYLGLCQIMQEHGLAVDPALQRDAITTEQAAMVGLLQRGQPIDAVFAASDLIAVGAMRALAEAGIAVPEDVAIIGFDDIPAASQCSPPLTTIMQDLSAAGERLLEAMVAKIEGRAMPSPLLPTRLIVRAST